MLITDILDQLLKSHTRRLLKLPNVVGVGQGRKTVRGEETGDQALVVLVTKKVDPGDLPRTATVPRRVSQVQTDVVEVGELRLLNRTGRFRPASPGVSISHYRVTAGTFGAVVRDRETGEQLILSNNHVLANSTTGRDGNAVKGDPILQPGAYDGGTQADIIARLERFVPIYPEYTESECPKAQALERLSNTIVRACRPNYRLRLERNSPQTNIADCAVAKPIAPGLVTSDILEVGPVRGTSEATVGMNVKKSGRSSGLNRAQVKVVKATISVFLNSDVAAYFSDQIVTGPLAKPGDSGSLVLDESNNAVGLLFAGSDISSICCRIQNVLDLLKITF